MNFLTLSSLVFVVLLGAVWSFRSFMPVAQSAVETDQSPEDHLILDDVPPPDDTYTPDQRRYS